MASINYNIIKLAMLIASYFLKECFAHFFSKHICSKFVIMTQHIQILKIFYALEKIKSDFLTHRTHQTK